MGDQDNAASAEDADNAMHIIWVKKDGSLHIPALYFSRLRARVMRREAQPSDRGVSRKLE